MNQRTNERIHRLHFTILTSLHQLKQKNFLLKRLLMGIVRGSKSDIFQLLASVRCHLTTAEEDRVSEQITNLQ